MDTLDRPPAVPHEPVTYHVPRPRRHAGGVNPGQTSWPGEPIKYRVPGAYRQHVHVLPQRPDPMEQALCDLVTDPANGIDRVTVVRSTPAAVASLERTATLRGIHTVAATSPSLRRGWVRLTRSRAAAGRELRRGAAPAVPASNSVAASARRLLSTVVAWLRGVNGSR